MKRKKYYLYSITATVERVNKIVEQENFKVLCATNDKDDLKCLFINQIAMHNDITLDELVIKCVREETIEYKKVGVVWL